MFFLGYNTNGFAHHRLEDAIAILADLGYEGVAITLDHHALNPFDSGFATQAQEIRAQLKRSGLRSVIETGARFLLDPRRKHQPTLLCPESELRQQRFEFLERAVVLAAFLGAEAVSFWSGTSDADEPGDDTMKRLADGCRSLSELAAKHNVRLGFEPEPGMFIDTIEKFAALFARVDHPNFGLTLDVGHLHCMDEPIILSIFRWQHVLWNVHIEDMRRGMHEHLMFGEGDLDFDQVFGALTAADYRGGVFVELSRHSHDAVCTAEKARCLLTKFKR